MNNNYLMINGKKIELTDEQVKQLMPEAEDDPFRKPEDKEIYYTISCDGVESDTWEGGYEIDNNRYDRGNCFLDKHIADIVNARHILHDLLYRFACQNGWTEDMWGKMPFRWFVFYNLINKKWETHRYNTEFYKPQTIAFTSEEIAERAIKEIVEPFVKEHPEVMPV